MDLIAGLQGTGFAGFVAAALMMELTPGPNMAYLVIVALSEGRRSGLAAVTGVAFGLSLLGLGATLGLGALIAVVPGLETVLLWCGVVYLLWLAWSGWRDAAEVPDHAPKGSSLRRFFLRGVTTNLLNPKAFAFYLTVIPAFLGSDATDGQFALLSATYVLIATVIHASLVLGASHWHSVLSDPRRRARMRRALSVALAGVAIWLALKA